MEEKISIISHCTHEQNNLKWELLNNSNGQFICANHTGQFIATYFSNIIELWDMSSSPICLSYLTVFKDVSECQCMCWSHCGEYLFAVFTPNALVNAASSGCSSIFFLWSVTIGVILSSFRLPFSVSSAAFIPETSNMLIMTTSDGRSKCHVSLDCRQGSIQGLKAWEGCDKGQESTMTKSSFPLNATLGEYIQLLSFDVEKEDKGNLIIIILIDSFIET